MIDWIYPPQCAGCGTMGVSWCENCESATRELPENTCKVCCELLNDQLECTRCSQAQPAYKQLRTWRTYTGPLVEAIHSLKYDRNVGIALALADDIMQVFDETGWNIDMVIPVPVSQERFRERGYNQTSLLAFPLSLHTGIPYRPRALKRVKATHAQVGLSEQDRRSNLHGAFRAIPSIVNKANILLIDDVATTGSTLEACSQALVNAGARDVYCLTLAKTLLSTPLENGV